MASGFLVGIESDHVDIASDGFVGVSQEGREIYIFAHPGKRGEAVAVGKGKIRSFLSQNTSFTPFSDS